MARQPSRANTSLPSIGTVFYLGDEGSTEFIGYDAPALCSAGQGQGGDYEIGFAANVGRGGKVRAVAPRGTGLFSSCPDETKEWGNPAAEDVLHRGKAKGEYKRPSERAIESEEDKDEAEEDEDEAKGKFIAPTVSRKRKQSKQHTAGPFWVHCAIADELELVLPVLESFELQPEYIGNRRVFVGSTPSGRKVYLSSNGTNDAQGPHPTMLAWSQLCPTISPSMAIMVGCMAGNPDRKVEKGDLVVASMTFDYMAGSIEETRQRSNSGTTGVPADTLVLDLAADLRREGKWTSLIQLQRPHAGTSVVHTGTVASAVAAVRNDWNAEKWTECEGRGFKKVFGVECEMHTFLSLAANAKLPCLCVKGVQDVAKDKAQATTEWRGYATQASSAFAVSFIRAWEAART